MKRALLLSNLLFIALDIQTQQLFSDCSTAFFACSGDPLVFEQAEGPGTPGEVANISCLEGNFPETNSIWIKWKIGIPGNIGFTIIPLDESDDIDFVLYRLTGGIANCNPKEEIRCMASGKNRGELVNDPFEPCTGATELNHTSKDTGETPGCSEKDNNFLADVEAETGEEFALFINNYYSSGGFLLEFTGSAGFEDLGGLCSNETGGPADIYADQLQENAISIGTPFPNPARDKLYLPVLSGQEFDNALLQVINSFGVVAWQQKARISIGEQYLTVPLEGMPAGIYFLKTTVGEGRHIVRFSKH